MYGYSLVINNAMNLVKSSNSFGEGLVITQGCTNYTLGHNGRTNGIIKTPDEWRNRPTQKIQQGTFENLGRVTPINDPQHSDEPAIFELFDIRIFTDSTTLPYHKIVNMAIKEDITKHKEGSRTFKVYMIVMANVPRVQFKSTVILKNWIAFPWRLNWSGTVESVTEYSEVHRSYTEEMLEYEGTVVVQRQSKRYPLYDYIWKIISNTSRDRLSSPIPVEVFPKPINPTNSQGE